MWRDAGREGNPRITALRYFGLGPTGEADAERDLKHYYEWLGDEFSSMIAGQAATDEDTVQTYAKGLEDAGCDELCFFPSSTDPEQVMPSLRSSLPVALANALNEYRSYFMSQFHRAPDAAQRWDLGDEKPL